MSSKWQLWEDEAEHPHDGDDRQEVSGACTLIGPANTDFECKWGRTKTLLPLKDHVLKFQHRK